MGCFPSATFPKMIGYGLADTEVTSIDRRASDEVLAMAVITTEADLIGALGSNDVTSVLTYDPISDAYVWYKTVSDVVTTRMSIVYFSPDGNRVLLFFYFIDGGANYPSMMFFNAYTGAM